MMIGIGCVRSLHFISAIFAGRAETLPEDQVLLGLEDVAQTAASDAGEQAGERRAGELSPIRFFAKSTYHRDNIPMHHSSGLRCKIYSDQACSVGRPRKLKLPSS